MKKIFILILFCLTVTGYNGYSQGCLSGYRYRVPITLNNSNPGALTFFQVKVIVNTQALVSAAKIRLDGGDIRFTNSAGTLLTYWYNPVTFNTTATEFWVKVDNIPVGSSSIYLFYGNATSSVVSSGDATFELFDDFDGTSINGSKWTRCGNVANVNLSGSVINFTSTSASPDGIIYSNQLFPSDVIVEADVVSASSGKAVVGMTDQTEKGYATTMEGIFPFAIMKLSVTDTDPLACQQMADEVIPPPVAISSPTGTWSFQWPAASSEIIGWPGGTQTYSNNTNAGVPFSSSKQIILGSHINASSSNGAFAVNWLRVRKSAIDPVAVPQSEQEYPVAPHPVNDGPYCEGVTIQFNSTVYAGVTYDWYFGGVYQPTLTGPAPSIPSSVPANSGVYTLRTYVPGCPAVIDSTIVNVSQASVAGTTFPGHTNTCSGANAGIVYVTGITGNVIRWEMANSMSGPWFTISSTNDSITYSNLIQTTYFRPVVKTASCSEAIGSADTVNISNPTIAGFMIGGSSVCFGTNSTTLNLVYFSGNINRWQYKPAGASTWMDITSNDTSMTFTNLTSTTSYRAEIQSGSCAPVFSAPATITVNPLPVPSFTSAAVCQGDATHFINNSTIPSGTITNYQWDFGNNNSSISISPVHLYQAAGTYTVTLTAISSAGCAQTFSALDTVNALPLVSFTPSNVCQGFPTNFVSSGTLGSYFWDHDNGTDSTGNHSYTYPSPGFYNVLLVVTTSDGCIDSIRHLLEVAAPVNVNFVTDSVCFGQPVNFINNSASGSSNVTYNWAFGDGNFSTLTSPVYTYAMADTFTVTLQAQVVSSSTCFSSLQKTVIVYPVPSSAFTLGDVCLIDSAHFINTTVYSGSFSDLSYNWAFGDATTDTITNPLHIYNSQGNYNVALTANTIEGCSASTTQLISVYPMPAANFTSSDVCFLNNMNFISTSTVSNGTLTYAWDFGVTGATSTSQTPVYLYANDGTYNVQLIATTNHNCSDTIVKPVVVFPLPFVDYANSPVCDGQLSTFTEQTSITPGSVVSFAWDFGDGSSSTSGITSHQFLNPGTYSVKLTATSDQSCVHDTTKQVIVNPVPVANFTAADACLGASNSFTNSSSILGATPLAYLWSFGDGATSTLTSPGHIYTAAGMYGVKLLATSGPGCADSIVKFTEAFSLPVVNAGIDSSISKGDEIELQGYSPSGVFYSWTPVSSIDNSTLANPVARPQETTQYVLTMTDVNGCTNTDSVVITVLNDFKLLIYNLVTPDNNGKNDYWKVTNIDYYPDALVQIFNSWGKLVYEKSNYQNDWQGTYKEDQLPDGTYYYVISFPGANTETNYKGSITLLRNK